MSYKLVGIGTAGHVQIILGVLPQHPQVRLEPVDTSDVPDAGSSSASRHVYLSGNAVYHACQAALTRRDEALRAETGETQVSASYVYHGRSRRPPTPYEPETGQCNPHISYSYGAEIALVEVDMEMGETEIQKMWAAHDAGRAINPAMYFDLGRWRAASTWASALARPKNTCRPRATRAPGDSVSTTFPPSLTCQRSWPPSS